MNNEKLIETFGDYVKFGRLSKNLNKSESARRVGITPQYMTDIETNRTIPSEDKIEAIVNVFELDEKTAFKLADKVPVRILEKAKKEYFGG